MSKPRVLVPVSLQFSVRYLLRSGLVSRLRENAQLVIQLAWEDDELAREFEAEGCEVHPLHKAKWGTSYTHARMFVNMWYERRLASPSAAIRERRANLDRPFRDRMQKRIDRFIRRASLDIPGFTARVRGQEAELFLKDTNAAGAQAQIDSLRPDAVFSITPFLLDDEMTVRLCALAGMPMLTAILSFDNLTTRSWMPVTFDRYLLWNRHNAQQLRRGYPEIDESRIGIVGSPQFDFYWRPEYVWPEDEWRQALGLPAGCPVILFGGGFYTCAPHEPQFLGHLDDAIERGEIPRDAVILFRRHPVDPIGRWKAVLDSARHVIYDDPWKLGPRVLGHTNVRHEDIAKLASTLYHCGVHVNVASSMTVDGAIMDRPQVGPAYDASPSRKYHRAAMECYLQEHYLPIYHSGGVAVARSRGELVAAVRSALENPAHAADGRRSIVEEICTFSDGRSAERVAAQFASFLARSSASLVPANS